MIVFAAALMTLAGSAAAATVDVPEPNPKKMSQAEIRAFNTQLEKGHKFYIRCRRTVATGSIVARQFSCRTNAQWAAAEALGNQEARDVMQEATSKSWSTGN